jgi:hypothetical protein
MEKIGRITRGSGEYQIRISISKKELKDDDTPGYLMDLISSAIAKYDRETRQENLRDT